MLFRKTKPLGFRKWIELENLKVEIGQAMEKEEFPEKVYSYLSIALDVPVKKLEKDKWENTVLSLTESYKNTSPKEIPLLKPSKESKPVDWDYPHRNWFHYSHLLASAYGWTVEYISELDFNEALSYIQEILTEDQLDREFEHGLSEVSYHYNKSTKKSDYKPLKRPYWMLPTIKPIKTFKIKRSLLPVGQGVDLSGLPPEYGIQKMIDSGR